MWLIKLTLLLTVELILVLGQSYDASRLGFFRDDDKLNESIYKLWEEQNDRNYWNTEPTTQNNEWSLHPGYGGNDYGNVFVRNQENNPQYETNNRRNPYNFQNYEGFYQDRHTQNRDFLSTEYNANAASEPGSLEAALQFLWDYK